MRNRLFCFGLGYSALYLARELARDGFEIAGTVRTEEKADRLRAEGFDVYVFSPETPLASCGTALKGTTHLLSSVPPGADGDPVLRAHGSHIIALAGKLLWCGYLSTTGVYGDRGGDWVDECSDLKPTGERGMRRAGAEAEWLDLWWDYGIPVHIFRLAGIYGPGRNAIEDAKRGTARRVIKDHQVFSRIHVADIAAVLRASMAHPKPGRIYNVCDDEAAPPQDVVTFAHALLGRDPPPAVPFEEAELSDMARSFYADNKRVKNERIKSELGVALKYPDYRAGLRAILAGSP